MFSMGIFRLKIKKVISIMILTVFATSLFACGTAPAEAVVKTITEKEDSYEKIYSIIYDNETEKTTDAFTPDDATFLYAEDDVFISNVKEGAVSVSLNDTRLTDSAGDSYDVDEIMYTLLECIAENAEHDIFGVTVIIDDGSYFVFEKHNVNLYTPCVLYKYDKDTDELKKLYQWENVNLIGISLKE